ncbi:Rieske 2Fe-2S domain-containing protein [Bordetella genomosp. 11]|uniref:Ring-hydroxylating oxygenase subunit alpha n=1 Tax=Bordetella genomosp. 11 TaxID=1416808 RepID=A0A261UFR7_9BORD|nr:Rieske 2Fe-2S domain-containing protein [Bordetella genomosp. 11]OZI60778.1 ring-hydroxylating oxygenase subunit alpha [Bordetella genomosp. 11]
MLTAPDNDLLTLTGPDQPMGQYFRRYWQPVALSRELPEPDGPPVRVQVMGEKLLAFRDTQGRVGLVEPVCPHRGADLYYGRNEDCGLRCVFHGWKFGVDGKAVDLPNVAPDSNYHKTMAIKAYPTREFGEIVWAYMGPRPDDGRLPEVPMLEFGTLPASRRYVTKKRQECNWAQALEGALDTSHFSFLHMPAPGVPSNENADAPADERRLAWIRRDPMPKFSILDHDVGFVVGGARRADGQDIYWRTAQFALPSHSTTPSTLPGENYFGYTFVPIDDHACWIYTYVWNPERDLTQEEIHQLKSGHGVVAEVDEHFIPLRNLSNGYLLDRQEQKHKTYTGVRGVAEQDAMIQESQGRIADRTREHLTATDAAIVRFRRTLIAGARALAQGIEPQAPWRHQAYRLRSGSWIAAQGRSFEDIMQERFGSVTGHIDQACA